MQTARLSDIDPHGLTKYFGAYDAPAFGGNFTYAHDLISGIAPRVVLRHGESTGTYMTRTSSFYINDLWTINDNHSVMGGLRFDSFNLSDSRYTFLSYTQPTLRFEYKWDVAGDQKRLINVSWGQFHTELPAGLYQNFVAAPDNNTTTWYWNTGSPRPHLVSKDDMLNLNNYKLEGATTIVATPNLWTVSSDFKQPISTEIAIGYRRNLEGGGSWKATYAYRKWQNDGYGYTASEDGIFIDEVSGTKLVRRVLSNLDGFERYYHGFELEWDFPINKRVTFGGNYTWRRLVTNNNVLSITDSPTATGNHGIYTGEYYDYMTGSRSLWAPLIPILNETCLNYPTVLLFMSHVSTLINAHFT
jgi:hypothetical protein